MWLQSRRKALMRRSKAASRGNRVRGHNQKPVVERHLFLLNAYY